ARAGARRRGGRRREPPPGGRRRRQYRVPAPERCARVTVVTCVCRVRVAQSAYEQRRNRMNRMLGALALVLSLVTVTCAAEPVSETYGVPLDKAWSVTQAVLKQLGWDIEKADREIGWITTDSRRFEGED